MDLRWALFKTVGGTVVACCVLTLGACHEHGRRVEWITSENAEFAITVAGTADHRRMGPGWKSDPGSAHNPTRLLVISNQGDRSVLNPRIVVDGGPDWFNIDHIVAEFARPGMTDQEKAFALWQWIRRNLSDGPTYNSPLWGDTRSMTRFMNACGTGACGTYHIVMPVIGRHAGLQTFSGCFADCSHAVQQKFFDGQQRFLDAHIPHEEGQPGGWFALKLNNSELAGVDEIMEDRYLIDRAGAGPGRASYVAYFGPGCRFDEMKPATDPRNMGMVLRPGESIVWQWTLHAPPWLKGDETSIADRHGSGYVEFRPRLSQEQVRYCADTADNLQFTGRQGVQVVVPLDASKAASLIYRLCCPYMMTHATVGGRFESDDDGSAMIEYSFDGRDYRFSWHSSSKGLHEPQIELPDDDRFHEPWFTHQIWFRITLGGRRTCLSHLRLRGDFQAYRPSLPSLHAGSNRIRFSGRFDIDPGDSPTLAKPIVVDYRWRDLPDLPVPRPPAAPVHPVPGGTFGFNQTLRWQPAEIPAPAGISGYEVYISPRPDLAWPVMPNTHRIVDGSQPAMQLVSPDVLRHGATYYWRVRGRSTDGVWGEWSPTWSFVAAGPGAPRDLRVAYDQATGSTLLTWSPPAEGLPADHYEIYGSSEHGFSPLRSDEEAHVHGRGVTRPRTLLGMTRDTRWDASTRTEVFYRVTAVDAQDNRGVPTPIVKVPSPALLPVDLPPAKVGQEYCFKLPARLRNGRFALSLREGIITDGADTPRFELVNMEWLSIDPSTGELKGTPMVAGKNTLEVRLDDGRGGKCDRRYTLVVQP
ncbi:MAG: hypothetical protein ACUVXJ_03510 [Phycisphaerae bacterium]